MSTAVRWCAVFLIFATVAAGQSSRKTLPNSINSLKLADDIIAKDRSTRTIGKIQKKLGFFGTLKDIIYGQYNDTKSAYSQLSELINGNFADSNSKSSLSSNQISQEGSSSTEEDEEEGTSTDPPPPQITREDFLGILNRNLIGLRRLFDQEWKQAMTDSQKNLHDYAGEFKSEMYKQVSGKKK